MKKSSSTLELAVAALEIAGAIAAHAMAERQILGSRRRANRIRLHEAEALRCARRASSARRGCARWRRPQARDRHLETVATCSIGWCLTTILAELWRSAVPVRTTDFRIFWLAWPKTLWNEDDRLAIAARVAQLTPEADRYGGASMRRRWFATSPIPLRWAAGDGALQTRTQLPPLSRHQDTGHVPSTLAEGRPNITRAHRATPGGLAS